MEEGRRGASYKGKCCKLPILLQEEAVVTQSVQSRRTCDGAGCQTRVLHTPTLCSNYSDRLLRRTNPPKRKEPAPKQRDFLFIENSSHVHVICVHGYNFKSQKVFSPLSKITTLYDIIKCGNILEF